MARLNNPKIICVFCVICAKKIFLRREYMEAEFSTSPSIRTQMTQIKRIYTEYL